VLCERVVLSGIPHKRSGSSPMFSVEIIRPFITGGVGVDLSGSEFAGLGFGPVVRHLGFFDRRGGPYKSRFCCIDPGAPVQGDLRESGLRFGFDAGASRTESYSNDLSHGLQDRTRKRPSSSSGF